MQYLYIHTYILVLEDRDSTTCAVVTLRKIRRKLNFAQVWIECAYG